MLFTTVKIMLLLLIIFLAVTQIIIPFFKGEPHSPLFKDDGKIWMDESGQTEENQWDYH